MKPSKCSLAFSAWTRQSQPFPIPCLGTPASSTLLLALAASSCPRVPAAVPRDDKRQSRLVPSPQNRRGLPAGRGGPPASTGTRWLVFGAAVSRGPALSARAPALRSRAPTVRGSALRTAQKPAVESELCTRRQEVATVPKGRWRRQSQRRQYPPASGPVSP